MALSNYIKERIEEGLTAISPEEDSDPNLKVASSLNPDSEGTSIDLNNNTVAQINFTYANTSLISKLRTRGSSIAGRKFEKLPEVEGKILQSCSLLWPKSVYVTFEDTLSVKRAIDSGTRDKGAPKVEILKSQCFGDQRFLPVEDPSEIIWEN